MRYLSFLIILTFFVVSLSTILRSKINATGDIAEYYGITESLIRHQSFNLTPEDQKILSFKINPDYYYNPGYYIANSEGVRFPVHFVFYSVLILPIRLALDAVRISYPPIVLAISNLIIFCLLLFYASHTFFNQIKKQSIFLLLSLFSPLVFFVIWPGPDIILISLLLISLFHFDKKHFGTALIFSIPASWMSQPLIIFSLLYLATYIFHNNTKSTPIGTHFHPNTKSLFLSYTALLFLAFPYIYNYISWGTLTPWTLIADEWTITKGVGIQNIGLRKLFEQFFDLNIGIFWYYPVFTIFGIATLIKKATFSKLHLLILITTLVTAFAFQTNPAWHYGTSGFSPSRHAIFLIAILIFILSTSSSYIVKNFKVFSAILVLQFLILSTNNFIIPNYNNAFQHTFLAKIILDNLPGIYRPTPEIFVDRTNHKDLPGPSSAIYRRSNICTKAYIIVSDQTNINNECYPLKPSSIFKDGSGTYYNF